MIVSLSFHANAADQIEPIIQWSEVVQGGIAKIEYVGAAKISQATNLIAYTHYGIGTRSAMVTLREIHSGDIRCHFNSQGRPSFKDFSPDGTKLLVITSTKSTNNPIARMFNFGALGHFIPYVYDTASCDPIASVTLDKGNYSGLQFSGDGLYLLGVRFGRNVFNRNTLFKVRIDGTEPIQVFHPQPSGVNFFYRLHHRDAFLVDRRVSRLSSASKVSIYVREKSDKRDSSRWWTRTFQRKNILNLEQDGPLTDGFILSSDQSRFAFIWPTVGPLEEPFEVFDTFTVIYNTTSFEESHRWVLDKGRERRVIKTNLGFYPRSSDIIFSMNFSGVIMIHRLFPDSAHLLLEFNTGIEDGFFELSHDGSLLVVSGKLSNSATEHKIMVYQTKDFGIDL